MSDEGHVIVFTTRSNNVIETFDWTDILSLSGGVNESVNGFICLYKWSCDGRVNCA